MPGDVPVDQTPAYPSWVELIHRCRWPILIVGFVGYGFIPSDAPKWLSPIAFFSSILGFWIKDAVGWLRRKSANRAGPSGSVD
jgi:hypothetical protein